VAVGTPESPERKPSTPEEEETMASATVHFPVSAVARPHPRLARRKSDRRSSDSLEGTPVLRLVGVALLGLFGLMVVVTAIAI
jgi:hypothetical protein